MSNGWVKMHRSIMEKGYYKKPDYIRVWIHLLLKANHKENEFWFNGENIKIKTGQFITGRKVLSSELKISESKLERILTFFEKKECQIEQQKTNKNRLISILNWNRYQVNEQPVNNQRTTSEQPVNTNKNDKKEKNDKKKPTVDMINEYSKTYSKEKGIFIEDDFAEDFFDHHEKIGWLVTKNKTPMKSWKATVRTWVRNRKKYIKRTGIDLDIGRDIEVIDKTKLEADIKKLKLNISKVEIDLKKDNKSKPLNRRLGELKYSLEIKEVELQEVE